MKKIFGLAFMLALLAVPAFADGGGNGTPSQRGGSNDGGGNGRPSKSSTERSGAGGGVGRPSEGKK